MILLDFNPVPRRGLLYRAWTFFKTHRMVFLALQWWITLILYGTMALSYLLSH